MVLSSVPQKPNRLKVGDTVAVLSPSWGGPSVFPHVFDLGLRNIESRFGLKIKEFKTARLPNSNLYENPRLRAEDINRAFADTEVKGIFASIGGDDSVRILPFLDLELIKANPKILMGYSDTTTLNSYLCSQGLVTYNGPSVMAGFAQLHHVEPSLADHIEAMLMNPCQQYSYQPYESWTNNYVNWTTPGYNGETAPPVSNKEGWRWLQGTGHAQGRLFGGCIEVFEFLKGTAFWPDLRFFDDKILFFETSEDKPSVTNVKYMLRNYGSMGVLDRIQGLCFGRARSYTDEEKAELDKVIVQVIAGEFGRNDIPIVSNMDFGHTDPQWILPLGVPAELGCESKTFRLLEPSVN